MISSFVKIDTEVPTCLTGTGMRLATTMISSNGSVDCASALWLNSNAAATVERVKGKLFILVPNESAGLIANAKANKFQVQ